MKKLLILPVVAFILVLSACVPADHDAKIKPMVQDISTILRPAGASGKASCKSTSAERQGSTATDVFLCTYKGSLRKLRVVTKIDYSKTGIVRVEGKFVGESKHSKVCYYQVDPRWSSCS